MNATILVNGLVRRPFQFPTTGNLGPRIERVEDFVCLEGWMRAQQHWAGYRLADVIAVADPLPEARYVEIASGTFVAVLPLEAVQEQDVLLADHSGGQPLTARTGGPWRLVAPGRDCYYHVKAVDRLTLVAHAEGETARQIALARIAATPRDKGEDRFAR